jgi:hypothetical protein
MWTRVFSGYPTERRIEFGRPDSLSAFRNNLMTRHVSLVCALFVFALTAQFVTGDDAITKAKCPVSGKAASKDHAVDYKGGKVYLCCGGCPGAFEKDTAKYAAKANHQLVLTGQAKQHACPLTGGKLNPDTKIEVASAAVCFCCGNCKGKAEKAKGDEQVELVFGDKSFEKGFKVGEKK